MAFGKMSLNFDTEVVAAQKNGTEAGDFEENFEAGRADHNDTVVEPVVVPDTEQSEPEGGLELLWTKEDKKVWIKYGLSPAYLKEMRKIARGCWESTCAPRLTFCRGSP